jgi:hypothetical protein
LRNGGLKLFFQIDFFTVPPTDPTTPEQQLKEEEQAIRDGLKLSEWQRTSPESGVIDGVPFLRVGIECIGKAPVKWRGFFCISKKGDTFITFAVMAPDPSAADDLKLATAAMLTFQKK